MTLREILLEDICREQLALEGPALDQYLRELGMDPDQLLQSFDEEACYCS
jgi:hypothetical protein